MEDEKALSPTVRSAIYALILVGLAPVCAEAQVGQVYVRQFDQSITGEVATVTINIGGDYQGFIILAYFFEKNEGRIAVCGLQDGRGDFPRQLSDKILRRSKVTAGGHVITEDLRYFFKEHIKQGSRIRAACRVTEFAWNTYFDKAIPKLEAE